MVASSNNRWADMNTQINLLSDEITQLSDSELDEVSGGKPDLLTVGINIGEFVMVIAATANSHQVWVSY
jgi:hypothetical protein